MHSKNIIFIFCFLFLFRAFGEKIYTVEDIPEPKRSGESYVSNPDGIISKSTVSALDVTLSRIANSGQAEIAVVILESIGNKVTKDFAVALFNLWKLGDKDKDNGLLVLIVNDQHRIEFETGYGMEAILTDAICKRIQMEYMIPYAKQGNLDQALSSGIDAVEQKLNNPEGALVKDSSMDTANLMIEETPQEPPVWSLLNEIMNDLYGFVFFGILSWFCLVIAYSPKKKGVINKFSFKKTFFIALALICMLAIPIVSIALWNVYGGRIDFPFYIVLGLFYLTWCLFVHLHYLVLNPIKNRSKIEKGTRFERYNILAESNKSISWFSYIFPFPFILLYSFANKGKMKKLRDEPYVCECEAPMVKLDEASDDAYLDKGQITEEQIKSTDYDVWVCNSCQRQLIYKYENYNSDAKPCPECEAKTLQQTTREIVEHATYSSSGFGYNHFACKNCGHGEKERFTIPMKTTSSSSSSGSGGSSSSSSGGSSGGGGSGSSW